MRQLAGLVFVTVLFATGCGGGADESPQAAEPTQADESPEADESTQAAAESAGELTTVRVSYLPVTGAVQLFAGLDQGFYADEGLEIETVEAAAPALVPGLVSGEVDIAYAGPPPAILGRAADLPLVAVAPMAALQEDPADCVLQALVAADSDIQTAADLEGRTVATDALYQLPHLSMIHAAESLGADPAAFEFIEIPFPAQLDAIAAGDVDAIVPTEPFLTIALGQGYRPVMTICDGFPEQSTASLWMSTEDWVAANPDVAERFARASVAASEWAADNPDAVRALIPEFTQVEADLAEQIKLPTPATELNRESFEIYVDALQSIGQLDEDFELDGLLPE